MKRRRWWIIGLALALLAGCVFGWKWSERPPFRFMKGATPYFVEVVPGPATGEYASMTYLMNQPFEVARKAAFAELGKASISDRRFLTFDPRPDVSLSVCELREFKTLAKDHGLDLGKYPPLDDSSDTVVTIMRRPTTTDRVRGWLYGLRWKGRRP